MEKMVEKTNIELMEGLIKQDNLNKFNLEVLHVTDTLIEEGFELEDIKKLLKILINKLLERMGT